jgi:ribosomal protein L10
MINTKKKITKIKTEKFLKEFPIVFLLQHNNFTVKDWLILKKQMDINENSDLCEKNAFLAQKHLEFDKSNKKLNNKTTTQMQFLNVKNSLLKKFLVNYSFLDRNKLNFLCQGPNFLIGCKEDSHFRLIWNSINSKNGPFLNTNSKLVFIACIYRNQLLNHLDLQTLVKLDGSVYSKFLYNLDKKTDLYNTLHQSLKLYPLYRIQYNFLNTLFLLKSSLINK